MVSTRHHPRAFPPPDASSPSKSASPAKATRAIDESPIKTTTTAVANMASDLANGDVVKSARKRAASRPRKSDVTSDYEPDNKNETKSTAVAKSSTAAPAGAWVHRPSNLTLIWLAISLPLVAWDTGYVLGRPHTMPGGKLHSPIWTPYALYGTIDHIYGWPAYNAHNGFTSAQGFMNIVESLGYGAYLYLLYAYGASTKKKGRGAAKKEELGWLAEGRQLTGKIAAWAALLGLGASLMTVSKTLLYGLNEVFSGFHSVGHNDPLTLILLWVIPNGAWLVVPSYMLYVFGSEVLEGLEIAATRKSR